jgi:hypothetical protein
MEEFTAYHVKGNESINWTVAYIILSQFWDSVDPWEPCEAPRRGRTA